MSASSSRRSCCGPLSRRGNRVALRDVGSRKITLPPGRYPARVAGAAVLLQVDRGNVILINLRSCRMPKRSIFT